MKLIIQNYEGRLMAHREKDDHFKKVQKEKSPLGRKGCKRLKPSKLSHECDLSFLDEGEYFVFDIK